MDPADKKAPAPPLPAGIPLAKLSLPRLAQGVSRPRLFAALDEARSRRSVWIAAPAGAGKTTLAATYLLVRKLPYVWYQLDQDDADPATFFYYLGLAARRTVSDPDFHLPLLTPEYLPDLLGFARRYFRTLFARLPAGTILVLDNYQDLGEAPLLAEILSNGIAGIPSHGNVLVLSRDEPPTVIESSDPGDLSLLDWDMLRLNYEETRAIVVQRRAMDDASLQALYRRADGWPAGVTLLLEQVPHSAPEGTALEGRSPAPVFQFFACEFFNQLPQSTQDFLLKTALLSDVTPALAEAVSGNPDAEGILGDLHRRRFFIHRRDLGQSSYQYHALFREFLLTKLPERYSPDAYIALSRQVAAMLREAARQEEAVSLLLRARDWQSAAPLLLEAAPVLFAQGRAQIIAAWLRQMPWEFVQSVPWLLYWRGMSHAFFDPESARFNLEQAHARFLNGNEVVGQMLAAAGIIDIIFYRRESLFKAAPWADMLQGLLARQPPMLPPALEAQLLSSLISVVELLRPNDPLLPRYAERLLEFLDADIDDNQKALIAPRLIIYHAVISGDAAACDAVLAAGNLLVTRPHVGEGARIHWKLLSVLPAIYLGQKGLAEKALCALIDFTRDGNLERNLRDQNLLHLRFLASWYGSLVCLAQENYPAVNVLLESMERAVDRTESIDMAIYAMVKTMHALGQGDLAGAKEYGELSLYAHNSVGAMITGLEVCCLLALERCASGEFKTALELLATPKHFVTATTPCIDYQVCLSEAFVYLSAGDAASCRCSLERAFSTARRNRLLGFRFWLARVMPALLSEALRAGIEPDFVREVVRTQNVAPPEGAPDAWPWSVRIHALGGLRVEVDGRELPQSRMQGKPLALLALLLTTGGKEARVEQLSEQLWPDSEGDAGLSAFSTTVSRLRKLIGDEGIVVQSGRVSLGKQRCWFDVCALEHRLDRSQRREHSEAAREEEMEAVLGLYRGPLLPREQTAWAADTRQCLRGRMMHWGIQLAAELRSAGRAAAAASLLDRIAAADPALAAE